MADYRSVKEIIKDAKGETALTTGFEKLDSMVKGFGKGELICVAGSASIGKTGLMLSILDNIYAGGDRNCLYFSLGETASLFLKRLLITASDKENDPDEKNNPHRKKCKEILKRIEEAGLYINDDAFSLRKIKKVCKEFDRKNHVDLIIIDYLQLVRAGKKTDIETDCSIIANELKQLARQLKCPVVVISRLDRNVLQRTDHRPRIEDLNDNTGLRFYADKILLLHREDYYSIDTEKKGVAEIMVAKNPEKGLGIVVLHHKGCGIFTDR